MAVLGLLGSDEFLGMKTFFLYLFLNEIKKDCQGHNLSMLQNFSIACAVV
jgi:hypothetical protein